MTFQMLCNPISNEFIINYSVVEMVITSLNDNDTFFEVNEQLYKVPYSSHIVAIEIFFIATALYILQIF